MLALTFAIKSTAPWPWLQDSSFPSLPAPFLNKPCSRLHPLAAVHTEWAVLSQCFSPDPWELCKTIKKAGEESEIETDRTSGRRGRRPTIDFQITLAFMSCPDTVSFWPLWRNAANSLKYLPSIFILSISPLIVPLTLCCTVLLLFQKVFRPELPCTWTECTYHLKFNFLTWFVLWTVTHGLK